VPKFWIYVDDGRPARVYGCVVHQHIELTGDPQRRLNHMPDIF
jgi:hypothetical protein